MTKDCDKYHGLVLAKVKNKCDSKRRGWSPETYAEGECDKRDDAMNRLATCNMGNVYNE